MAQPLTSFFSQPPKQTLANSFQVCFPIGFRCPIKYLDCQAHKSCSLSRLRGTQSVLLQKGCSAGSLRHTQQGGGHGENETDGPTDLHSGKQHQGLSSPDPIHQDVLSGVELLGTEQNRNRQQQERSSKVLCSVKTHRSELQPATLETLLFHLLAVAAETFKLPQA